MHPYIVQVSLVNVNYLLLVLTLREKFGEPSEYNVTGNGMLLDC